MLEIIYEDNYIIVCKKPVGFDSEYNENSTDNMITALENQCNSSVYPVHRLDKAVSGIMLYAKDKASADKLCRQALDKTFLKEYLAVVQGELEEKDGRLFDFLFKDSKANKTYVVNKMRKGVKEAILNYNVLDVGTFKNKTVSLLHIMLETGRTHQIRVQFASRKHPIIGDGKYGSDLNCPIGLWSYNITFKHPKTNENMEFILIPTDSVLSSFKYDFYYGEMND